MHTIKRVIAGAEVVVVFPAALFLAALFARNLTPRQNEPARSAQRIVEWFATQPVHLGLWLLLMGLPAAVLATGAATLIASWSAEPELRAATRQVVAALRVHLATVVVLGATILAAVVLACVGIHVLTD